MSITAVPGMAVAAAESVATEGSALAGLPACSAYIEHFERVAAAYADRVAVSAGGRAVSYRELDRQAHAYARALEGLGCGTETVVAVCCDRSIALVAALIAVMKANAAFLPLDPQFPQERLRTLVQQSGARVVLAEPRHAGVFDGCDVSVMPLVSGPAGAHACRRRSVPHAASLAYVIYTSGSTGVPKGVAVTHESFYRYVRWALDHYRFDPDGASVVHTSIGFDLTLTSLFCPLLLGMRLVLVPDDEGVDGVLRLLNDGWDAISLLKLTPSHLALIAGAGSARRATWDCDVLIVGGEQLATEAVAFWQRQSPRSRVFNEYGPTEATVGCCVARVPAVSGTPHAAVPIGAAIDHAALHLHDPFVAPAALRDEGELFIGGPCLARGYLNAPASTSEKFIPDPASWGGRLYRTGDWVRQNGHELLFVGRKDRQRKINGVRVELGEIEEVLKEYPGVRGAAVVPVRDTAAKDTLTAFVAVADPEAHTVELAALVRHVSARVLPAAVPGEFYLLQKLPLAISGKVDYQALVRQRPGYVRLTDRFVPPRNPTEELLASLWRGVLGLDEIGIDDSFFALDGNSMKSIQVVYEAKKQGLALSTRDLFEHQTIRRLAERMAAAPVAGLPEPFSHEAFALVDPRDRARMPDAVVDAYPLALLQAGTLLESDRRAGSGTYHNVNSYHLECELDPDLLKKSLALAARRHPILRTCYDYVSFHEPLQLVHAEAEIPLTTVDIRHLTDDEQRRSIAGFIEAESRIPFDWTKAPLLRFFIHRRAQRRVQFTLSKHHSILDGWSAATLIAEIVRNYFALSKGQPPPCEGPLQTTYRDYVALERQAMQSRELGEFWRETLRDAPYHALRPWGGERPRADGASSSATSRMVPVSAEVTARLKELATRARVPLKSVLLAIHLRVLAQMTGSTRIVTGVVSHGRPETADADKAIGLFINTVPFHVAIDERFSWWDLIQRAFQEERRVFPYQRYPMARIKKDAGWDRLFESIFYYTNFQVFREFRSAEDLRCIDSTGFEETEIPFTSAFSLHPLTSTISLRLHFHVDHFSEPQIATVVSYFERALAAVTAAPERAALADSLLGAEDSRPYPVAGDEPLVDSGVRRVSDLVAAHARTKPDAVALAGRDRQLTYGTMLRRIERLAGLLARQGIAGGHIVGICTADVADAIVAMLAANRVGACFVVLDPQWPDARLREVLAQLEPSLVVADSALTGRFSTCAVVDAAGDLRSADTAPPATSDADHLAYIVFTSGSTGKPKGVMVGNRNLLRSTASRLDYYKDGYERFLLLSRLTFDSSFAGIWGTLCGGGTLHVLGEDRLMDVGLVARVILDEGITHFLAIPSLYRVLLPELAEAGGRALRAVILAGEELTRDLVQAHREHLPGVALYNEYGPSEVTVWSTVADLGSRTDGDRGAPVSIGAALVHVDALVLDEGMRPTSPGAIGELYLGGTGVGRGYYGAPSATARRFMPNPYAAGLDATMLYRTGDLVRRSPDDELQFVGRSDNQVKVRGFRIEPEEIERAFYESFGVRDVMVGVREDAPGRKRICLYYVALDTESSSPLPPLDVREVRATLGQRLPAYTLPDEVAEVERLPRLPNNKLDRSAMATVRATRAAVPAADPPSSEIERALAGIWCEALTLPDVGVRQSFFDIGGDSLLANQVVLRSEKLFGVKLRLKEFYRVPTISAHAQHLESQGKALGVDFERVASIWNHLG